MRRIGDGIPGDILKEIFPDKLNTHQASDTVYTQLKEMILSGKLGKGQSLLRSEFLQSFGINEGTLSKAFSRLRKDGLIIVKGGGGSFVA
jgi:GntR family transcriptional regulator, transcriptional repressor for pyruvate dehydrogenase complex